LSGGGGETTRGGGVCDNNSAKGAAPRCHSARCHPTHMLLMHNWMDMLDGGAVLSAFL